jgi:hypothetical protein
MEEDLDPFDFVLAEALHMTLAQLADMSNAEYLAWRAFHVYRQAMTELAGKEAK